MKLATSTGDYAHFFDSIPDMIGAIGESSFKNVNLEQTGIAADVGAEWERIADEWGNAAALAGVNLAVSHAPCRHFPHYKALEDRDDEEYRRDIDIICRSIQVCGRLGIPRTVVHACAYYTEEFTKEIFYKYNEMFYRDILPTAEKCGVMLLAENWDGSETHFSTGAQMREFLDYINHPLLCACWDTAHGNIDKTAREIGQYDNISALGDKLKGLHISDNFGNLHHHSWPFAGVINFDSVMQGLLDVGYDGYFTFEASYTIRHSKNMPMHRSSFRYRGERVTRLLNPSVELKKKATDLLYETGKYILSEYVCFEE